jgi:hypothetical protein
MRFGERDAPRSASSAAGLPLPARMDSPFGPIDDRDRSMTSAASRTS